MEAYVTEWLSLLVRWIHVIAAIAWIGHAFLFHSFEHGLKPPESDDVSPDVNGELWMVHGGGFFRLQKTRVLPGKYTGELLWFKWEAAFTWLSGFLLLILVFYMGGGIYLVDPSVSGIGTSAAMGIGLGTMVGGWLIYDLIWSTRLARLPVVPTVLTVGLIAGATLALPQLLSGRAAYIHVGALMGTIMVANVWMRILPGMRRMIAAMERGEQPDLRLGEIGKQRSLHNGYMHFPIIFVMISNHFPSTYASEHNGLILILIMVFGACMRQVLYDGLMGTHAAVKLMLAVSLGGLVYITAPIGKGDGSGAIGVQRSDARDIDMATVGGIRGTVGLTGTPPAPKALTLWGGCESLDDSAGGTPAVDTEVIVTNGRVKNGFVWIRSGWEGWNVPAAPAEAVELDQRACVYAPRVIGVRVGQPITFVNSDPLFHNVRSVAEANSVFNLNMPAKDQRLTRTFKRPEVMVQARCDVHPWMRAYIGVVPHPWFSVTDDDGAFSLEGVPPGQYVVEVWHEVLGTQTHEVTVAPGQDAEISFELAQ